MGFKYKIYDQSKAYYVTLTVVQWIDIFSRKSYRDIIIDSLKYCQKNKGLVIYAYVIMSNHVHMLISAEKENLSDVIRDFKKFTCKKNIKE
ncbi:MAG: transposase [Bacteroidota bacterium]